MMGVECKMDLTEIEFKSNHLVEELQITIQTPIIGLDNFLVALRDNVKLTQGNYDNCVFISATGSQQFKCLEGSHAGEEDAIHSTDVTEVIITINRDANILKKLMEVIHQYHVHEEPSIRIIKSFGSRSKGNGDKSNPNKYWNKINANEIHGKPITKADTCVDRGQ